jgi:hypothetical protein
MASCNPKKPVCWHFVTPVVAPKMADFLGCNLVTPFLQERMEKREFGLARRSVILYYTDIYWILARLRSAAGESIVESVLFHTLLRNRGYRVTTRRNAGFLGLHRGLQEGLARGYKAGRRPWPAGVAGRS